MTGLIVLAVVTLYVALWWFMVRALKSNWLKPVAVFVALGIPFWELPFGYSNFHQHCLDEGGLRVQEKFGPSNSILIDRSLGYSPTQVLAYGFQTVEYDNKGRIVRFTKTKAGVDQSTDDLPKSRLTVKYVPNQDLSWGLLRNDIVASNIADGTVLAKHTDFRWLGTWWQATTAPLFGYGYRCFSGPADPVLTLLVRGSSQ